MEIVFIKPKEVPDLVEQRRLDLLDDLIFRAADRLNVLLK